jgi:exodeoxyribonuclease VII large subunit
LQQPRRQLLLQPAERLDRLRDRLRYAVRERASAARQASLRLERRLSAFNPREQAVYARRRADTAQRRLGTAMQTLVRSKRRDTLALVRQLDALSPLKVMQRGYSLVYDEKGKKLVNSTRQVQIGDIIKVRLKDGRLQAHVWGMEEESE